MSRTQGRIRHVTEAASLRIEAGMGRPSPELRSRLTFGRSPVRESRTPGSVRGDRGNPVPYRDWLRQRVVLLAAYGVKRHDGAVEMQGVEQLGNGGVSFDWPSTSRRPSTKSTVQWLLHRRMSANQQMRW